MFTQLNIIAVKVIAVNTNLAYEPALLHNLSGLDGMHDRIDGRLRKKRRPPYDRMWRPRIDESCHSLEHYEYSGTVEPTTDFSHRLDEWTRNEQPHNSNANDAEASGIETFIFL